jgi:hypothetical protein
VRGEQQGVSRVWMWSRGGGAHHRNPHWGEGGGGDWGGGGGRPSKRFRKRLTSPRSFVPLLDLVVLTPASLARSCLGMCEDREGCQQGSEVGYNLIGYNLIVYKPSPALTVGTFPPSVVPLLALLMVTLALVDVRRSEGGVSRAKCGFVQGKGAHLRHPWCHCWPC